MGRLTRRECAGIVFGSRQQYEIGLVHRNRVGSEAVLFWFLTDQVVNSRVRFPCASCGGQAYLLTID